MTCFVYILKCSDGSYYSGSTRNIQHRLDQHYSGKGSRYTHDKRPLELVYLEEHTRIDEAFYREKQIQGWSRKKKEALMQSDWQSLHKLAECKNASTSQQPHGFEEVYPELVEGLSNRASSDLSKPTSPNEKY